MPQDLRDLHIFIPLYFDTKSFLLLRERVHIHLPKDYDVRFHVLDDSAGRDKEVRKLASLPDVIVQQMPYNLGHQRALVYGLRSFLTKHKSKSLILTMDGDGQDRPEDFPALLKSFEENAANEPVVFARRTARKESLTFKLFYIAYKRIFKLLTGTLIQTGNYILFPSSIGEKLLFHPYFDLSFASSFVALASDPQFVPCPRGARYEGESKMNFLKLALHGVRMLMPFMDRIAIRGAFASAFFVLLSLIFSLSLIVVHFAGIRELAPWVLGGTIFALVMALLSICNFIILITIFFSVQGLAFSRLDVPSSLEKA